MNNDAFQKLVKERATEKSSKEIAREAVEQEFQQHKRKRKRRRGAGGSSDEDGDDDDSDVDDDHKQKKDEKKKEQQQQEDHSKQGAGKKEKAASKYRDRAKERREGDNTDYQDSQRLLAGVVAAAEDGEDDNVETISKFLGGDEAYTHLVKGLDVTLAKQSVRKQNASMQPARKTGDILDSEKRPHFAENKNDAKELIVTDVQLVSELGREMLDYLCNYHASTRDSSKAVAVTPAGLVVQRSTLTFSLQANPGEFVRSWEVPREQTYATTSDGTAYTKASPLPSGLLDRIENTLTRQMSLAREQTNVAGSLTRGTTDAREEEDSEDDIFGDVGDYVPSHEPNGDTGAVVN
jgi:hypothetical protein